jgi:hypothetical protein
MNHLDHLPPMQQRERESKTSLVVSEARRFQFLDEIVPGHPVVGDGSWILVIATIADSSN